MEFPKELYYTEEHEWVRMENGVATMGITDYAQDKLGDIVFVELPKEEEKVTQGEPFGVVESVKAVSDIYAAMSGVVTEVNEALADNPEILNEDCYEEGWLIKVKVNDSNKVKELMTGEQYEAFLAEEAE